MIKFIKNIMWFCLPLVLIAYPLDLLISNSIVHSNKYPGNYTAWNAIYSGEASSDILIFGSSRATHHYNPMLLQDSLKQTVYNLGINGHGFWLQHLKYLEYLKHNKPPKTIIVNAGWFALEKRPDLYQYNQFLPYMLWNKNIKQYTQSYQGFSRLDYMLPSLRYYGNFTTKEQTLDYLLKSNQRPAYKTKGFVAVSDNSEKTIAENLKVNSTKYKAQIDESTVLLLDNFIKLSQEHNITIILVYSPEYIMEQQKVINRDKALSIYKTLAEKYQIPFWDFSDSYLSANRKYFNSTMHLNELGSHKFTETLIRRIKAHLQFHK